MKLTITERQITIYGSSVIIFLIAAIALNNNTTKIMSRMEAKIEPALNEYTRIKPTIDKLDNNLAVYHPLREKLLLLGLRGESKDRYALQMELADALSTWDNIKVGMNEIEVVAKVGQPQREASEKSGAKTAIYHVGNVGSAIIFYHKGRVVDITKFGKLY